MKRGQLFDFQSLLSDTIPGSTETRSKDAFKCVVGVAWTGRGVGLVALTRQMARGTQLKAYNNIAFGPIEADWNETAQAIARYLPIVFADKSPQVFLGGSLDKRGAKYETRAAFERAFPGLVELIDRDKIDRWAACMPLSIAFPSVPPRDAWALQPLYAAAETALYAGHLRLDAASSHRGSDWI